MTIRELYGLDTKHRPVAPVRAETAMVPGTEEAGHDVLLSHSSFQALFADVKPDVYVAAVVVACYLGVSRHSIQRKLNDLYATDARPWRSMLAERHHAGGVAFRDELFRWSFVREELAYDMVPEVRRTNARRDELRQRSERRRQIRRVPFLQSGPPSDAVQFVINGQGLVVGALGQGHTSAMAFIAVINEGGRLMALDPVDALGRPWSDMGARGAWEAVVFESLLAQAEAIRQALSRGREMTERVIFGPSQRANAFGDRLN
ncbi:hypothetical protein [Luteibacter sp. UNCMF331Sha3.1]|uniref:hypothetical protein n=1 Tax=Luteibacter sp. UNCMF331Sha3.1 TaxID=1502760 RepID=UPI001113F8A9|nr:hypothetical protein [Luteibacter sp. UNCMF331Sha3.1]